MPSSLALINQQLSGAQWSGSPAKLATSVAKSDLRPGQKVQLIDWIQKMDSLVAPSPGLKHQVLGNVTAGATGAALGAVHSTMGLDRGRVPLDLVGSLLSSIAGSLLQSGVLQEGGKAALAVFSFRKVGDLIGAMKDLKASGDFGCDSSYSDEDPIIAAGKGL
jgi:hypothetical protein